MELNPQQQAVVQWATTQTGSLNLVARAGCGKTSTIIELTKHITGKVFLGAFNRAIATELQTRIGARPGVTAGTMHSLGLSLWRNIRRNSKIESKKVRALVHKHWSFDKKCQTVCAQAVAYGKQAGLGLKGCGDYTTKEPWDKIFDHYDLWDEMPGVASPDRMIQSCQEVYDESLQLCMDERDSEIDFDDMILAPLYFAEGKPNMYDWFLMDEAQDTNETRRRLAMFVLKPQGRMVAVGDPAQAIYGFAGANHDSMDLIKRDMQSVELPLSITYRCPKAIVALAQTLVPDITAHESAPEGTIRTINHQDFWKEQFTTKDVILCRNTRPLLGIAKRLRKAGIDCRVEGNSSRSMVALAEKWGDRITISEMLKNMGQWLAKEEAKWTGKGRMDKVEAAQERASMLSDIANDFDMDMPVYELVREIEDMFGDNDDGREILRLCTAHRAKGREWDRVFLVGRNLYMPSKWAEQEWEITQEQNLVYVAWTRVKDELVEVVCPKKKSSEDIEWWEA